MIHLAHYAAIKDCPLPHFAISNGVPSWAPMERIDALCPAWEDVRAAKAGEMSPETFIRRYWNKLGTVDPVYYGSLYLDGGTGFCYERPGELCHRRALAAWLVRHGYPVTLDGVVIDATFRILGTSP